MTAALPIRTIALEGCGNFRDLGGYSTTDGRTTRWRTIFRSDTLHQLTAADVETLAAQEVRLSAGFDLRSVLELERSGAGVVYELGARHYHVPMIQVVAPRESIGQMAPGQSYLQRLEEGRSCFASLFEMLADDASYPAAFYCAAGKDRTGIVAALLLRVLGVDDEQIVADYALTQPMSEERRAARLRELGWDTPLDPALYVASPDTMALFLVGLDERWGSAESYLDSCGVGISTIERVRSHLLE